jgi:hypothetical protein
MVVKIFGSTVTISHWPEAVSKVGVQIAGKENAHLQNIHPKKSNVCARAVSRSNRPTPRKLHWYHQEASGDT